MAGRAGALIFVKPGCYRVTAARLLNAAILRHLADAHPLDARRLQ